MFYCLNCVTSVAQCLMLQCVGTSLWYTTGELLVHGLAWLTRSAELFRLWPVHLE